jgi:hypothetical protein
MLINQNTELSATYFSCSISCPEIQSYCTSATVLADISWQGAWNLYCNNVTFGFLDQMNALFHIATCSQLEIPYLIWKDWERRRKD